MNTTTSRTRDHETGGDAPPWVPGLFTTDEPLRLLGSRCVECGHTAFPVRTFCPRCRREPATLETVTLPRTGSVHTFTVVHQAPEGVATPYVLARVTLDGGVRVLATVTTCDPRSVAIGSRVELAPAMFPRQSERLAGFCFRTITEEGA